MSKIDNILTGTDDLKKMPYSLPEGYFEGLSAKVHDRISQETVVSGPRVRRVIPMRFALYAAAAVVAVLVAVGVLFGLSGQKAVIPEGGLDDSDYVFYFTEVIPVTDPESIYYSYNDVSGDLDFEDIINYLYGDDVDLDTMFDY
ncbi:MAG: hypothetical protein LUD72_08055 [Bacteroidales bacterium]|nr:hypothetical protein [Bacteroidales bacterium]